MINSLDDIKWIPGEQVNFKYFVGHQHEDLVTYMRSLPVRSMFLGVIPHIDNTVGYFYVEDARRIFSVHKQITYEMGSCYVIVKEWHFKED